MLKIKRRNPIIEWIIEKGERWLWEKQKKERKGDFLIKERYWTTKEWKSDQRQKLIKHYSSLDGYYQKDLFEIEIYFEEKKRKRYRR